MDTKRLAALLGGVLLGVGLLLGFLPVRAQGVDCGSAFAPSNNGLGADYAEVLSGGSVADATHQESCDDATSGRRTIALALGIPGAVLLIGAAGAAAGPKPKSELPA